jgi:heme/copper-type cytochrome/quinol oxidase subunit 2
MALAIVLILIVVASVLSQFLGPRPLIPAGSNWVHIDDTLIISLVITGVVFVAIILYIAYAVIRFRHRQGSRAAYQRHNKTLEGWLTIWTTMGIVAMLAPGLWVYSDMVHIPKEASVLEVVANRNEASGVSTNRVAHRCGSRGLSGAAAGSVDSPSCGSTLIAYEILSNQPRPPGWS